MGGGSHALTGRPPALGALPKSTKAPVEGVNPVLSFAIQKWMKNHGKAVKPKLSEEQKANMRTCFRMMDADGSGAVDADELGAAFKLLGLGLSRREVDEVLREVDRDGSGEVEYEEFLEIMTLQLNRLAEKKEAALASSPGAARGISAASKPRWQPAEAPGRRHPGGQPSSPRRAGLGDKAGVAGAAAAAAAASLPFDVVVSAYRRKKLIGALQEDDMDFILSVAALEEEERQRAALEAEQAAERLRRASLAALRSTVPGVTPLASHAGFLAGMGWEERRVIESLSRKARERMGPAADPVHIDRGAPRQAVGSALPAEPHLVALQAVSKAEAPHALARARERKAGSPTAAAQPSPGIVASTARKQQTLQAAAGRHRSQAVYKMLKAGAGSLNPRAAAAAVCPDNGLALPMPRFSSALWGSGC